MEGFVPFFLLHGDRAVPASMWWKVFSNKLMGLFSFVCPFTESSDEDEASGDEGLPDNDSDVSLGKLNGQLLILQAQVQSSQQSEELVNQ